MTPLDFARQTLIQLSKSQSPPTPENFRRVYDEISGIESINHSEILKNSLEKVRTRLRKGCMNYQGYLFGRPVPIMQFEDVLKHELHILSVNFKKQPSANILR